MRTAYDINGNDVTSTVNAYLQANRTLFLANLYSFIVQDFWHFNSEGDYVYFTYTDADFPIFVNKMQQGPQGVIQLGTYSGGSIVPVGRTFVPERIKRSVLEYDIGFAAKDTDVLWFIDDNKDYTPPGVPTFAPVSPPNLTLKQAFLLGAFDEVPFWIHRAIFSGDPARGGVLLGIVLMFRGFVRSTETAVDHLKIGLGSLLEIFQTNVPSQLIQPNDRGGLFMPVAQAPYSVGGINNITVIAPNVLQFATHSTIPRNGLQDCYVIFQLEDFWEEFIPMNGLPPPPFWRISGNDQSTGTACVCYFYEPPVVPNGGSFCTTFGAATLSGLSTGFPYVPPPTFAP